MSPPPRPHFLQGIGVSPGIGQATAFVLQRRLGRAPRYTVPERRVAHEVKRFLLALKKSKHEVLQAREKIDPKTRKDLLYLLDAHLLLLEDEMLARATVKRIRRSRINAEGALEEVLDGLRRTFDRIEDDYLRERKMDLDYVGERLLRNLGEHDHEALSKIPGKVVLVAHDLSPADTAHLSPDKVVAFVTDMGSRTSHTAIMARALQIPAVVGLGTVTRMARSGEPILVDGLRGRVVVRPSEEILRETGAQRRHYLQDLRRLERLRKLPAITLDGRRVRVRANIELVEEIPTVIANGAEGVGLYRTEFFYIDQPHLPTEEDHFRVYRKVVERTHPHPATIRTFDLGGDKFASAMPLAKELNPALGLRAIRFCLKEVDIFKEQLRGLLRASVHGRLAILLPMISELGEVRQTRELLAQAMDDLKRRHIPYDPDVPIGAMIETPSACITADLLARELDFFSIGTNDLIQYTMAIDRVNEDVAYLYQPLHPAILRLIQRVVEAGRKAGIPVGLCGEMAGEPLDLPVLLGLGIDEISMTPTSIPRIKKLVRGLRYEETRRIADRALRFNTGGEVVDYVRDEMSRRFPEEFPSLA